MRCKETAGSGPTEVPAEASASPSTKGNSFTLPSTTTDYLTCANHKTNINDDDNSTAHLRRDDCVSSTVLSI